VREAARLLQTLDIRHLPVVDEEGALVGMLSDRDLRGMAVPQTPGKALPGDGHDGHDGHDGMDAHVATLMTADVLSVQAEDDVSAVIDVMIENKVGAVPVIDGDGALVGIVSYVDILRELPLDRA
jgi:acetoin utilization protein AcuB